ncbi:MAG: DNA repair protein RecN [Lachnospiraceae bacterium]|nr:DNA repair protein RecN [Lachnospiraceae bacterium]
MLQSLHVANIALIDDVEIDFTEGLNILTGETGAGKSILIDSVNFALGARMPKDVVRDENVPAICELVFSVDDDATRDALKALDVMLTDDQVILQRRIVNGKSSSKVNGETVPATLLRDISGLLIDIHGQHEHQSLLYKKNHAILLDSFCGDDFDSELCKLHETYDLYKKAEDEYEKALASQGSAAADLDYAKFVVNEIEAADLKSGEDEELESDFTRMNNSRKIAEILSGVESALSSDSQCASSMISYAVSGLKQITGMDEGALGIYEQLAGLEDLLSDCMRELTSYEESLEYSPEDYERVKERLDLVNSLKMKYGQSIDAINGKLAEESAKIERLGDLESYISDLRFKKEGLYDKLSQVCAKVSNMRHEEAKVLQAELVAALNNLNFLDARFEIRIVSDEKAITRNGIDDVEFLISTNPGEDLKPLTDVASGGELSRIMLALKSVLAKRDNIGTLIFDEIDSGISGMTAQLVADRMSDIAEKHQVIAVTHLPQIASHATTHFLIEKSSDGTHTSTSVTPLSYEGSVEELARMLAGSSITDAVRVNAEELKKKQKIKSSV